MLLHDRKEMEKKSWWTKSYFPSLRDTGGQIPRKNKNFGKTHASPNQKKHTHLSEFYTNPRGSCLATY